MCLCTLHDSFEGAHEVSGIIFLVLLGFRLHPILLGSAEGGAGCGLRAPELPLLRTVAKSQDCPDIDPMPNWVGSGGADANPDTMKPAVNRNNIT